MATATIIQFENTCSDSATVKLYSGGTMVYEVVISANSTEIVNPGESVPLATKAGHYSNNHVEVTVDGLERVYTFWQSGDEIYYSLNGSWNETDEMAWNGSGPPSSNNIQLQISDNEGSVWVIGEIENI